MREILLVALGGSVGAVGRWAVSGLVYRFAGTGFPFGTLAVNVLGSFLMGLVLGLALDSDLVPPAMRLVITAGFLGAFTTFSTFSWETLRLLEDGSVGLALGNLAVSLVLGLSAAWAGLWLSRLVLGGG